MLGWLAALIVALAPGGESASGGEAARGAPAKRGLTLDKLATFDQPMYVAAPRGSGGLAYVVERQGRIRLLRGDRKLSGSFLDISGRVSCCAGERGLITIAFAPDYQRSRRFYVFFTNDGQDIEVDEYKRSRRRPLRASARTRRKLLEIPLRKFPTHDGGQLAFGPDRLLYISVGDGGSFERLSGNSQRKQSLFGKILRIDPAGGGRRAYGVPRSNPYVGERGANEVYARGLRNPWRFAIDRGRILIADVGHDRREELDVERLHRARGANFGWDIFEGTLRFQEGSIAHHTKPIHEYPIGDERCSIIGGYVIRDRRLPARLRGRYLYSDFCTGELRTLRPNLSGATGDGRLDLAAKPGIVSFGEDSRRRLYAVAMDSGAVYRLDPRR